MLSVAWYSVVTASFWWGKNLVNTSGKSLLKFNRKKDRTISLVFSTFWKSCGVISVVRLFCKVSRKFLSHRLFLCKILLVTISSFWQFPQLIRTTFLRIMHEKQHSLLIVYWHYVSVVWQFDQNKYVFFIIFILISIYIVQTKKWYCKKKVE